MRTPIIFLHRDIQGDIQRTQGVEGLDVNLAINGGQIQHWAFAFGKPADGEFGFAAGFGQISKAAFFALCAIVIGEGELRIFNAVDVIDALINFEDDIAPFDFNGFAVFFSCSQSPLPPIALKVKHLTKTAIK